MLEDGKNASEEKHEGNGQMKQQKEEEAKQEQQQEADEKVKETTEPTETTPMIQGQGPNRRSIVQVNEVDVRTLADQDLRHRKQQVHNQHNPAPIKMQVMGQNEDYERKVRSQNSHITKPHIAKVIMKKNSQNQSGYGPSGRPYSMAMALENPVFNTGSSMRSSNSTPILDHDTSTDSIYEVPFVNRQAYYPETPKPKPPLPMRNPDTRLSLGRQSQSHDKLLNHVQESATDTMLYGDQSSFNRVPGSPYHMSASREALNQAQRPPYNMSASREALNQAQRPPYNMSASREALNQAQRVPYNMSASREALNQAQRVPYNMSASREALNQVQSPPYNMSASREALNQAQRPPYNMSASREAQNQVQRPPYNMSASREALNQAQRVPCNMSASREALNQVQRPPYNMSASREALNQGSRLPYNMPLKNGIGNQVPSSNSSQSGIYETIKSPMRSPSQSSLSTLYQPIQSPHYDAKPKLAYEIAPYDDPVLPNSKRKTFSGKDVQPKPMSRFAGQPSSYTSSPPQNQNVPRPIRPMIPPPAPPPSTEKKDDKKPLKTVTTMYLRERPQQQNHSQSMDNLDAAHYPSQQDSRSSTSYSPQSMTSARSLGSLLSTDSSQRSYKQPTLI